jgi:hypothetical protein
VASLRARCRCKVDARYLQFRQGMSYAAAMSRDPRSSARAVMLASALSFDPSPLDPFLLLRVPAIVRYVTSSTRSVRAWMRCRRGSGCSARRRGSPARR